MNRDNKFQRMGPKLLERCRSLPVVNHLYLLYIGIFFDEADSDNVAGDDVGEHVRFVFCTEGEGRMRIGKMQFPLEAGMCYAVRSSARVCIEPCGKGRWCAWVVGMTGSELDGFIEKAGFGPRSVVGSSLRNSNLAALLESIYTRIRIREHSDYSLLSISLSCIEIVFLFLLSQSAAARSPASDEDRIRRVISFMRENIDSKLRLVDLAGRAGFSISAFNRKFKEMTGETPVNYYKHMRMESAREMLRGGGVTIAEVSDALGYSDQYCFSHAFKRHFGDSPSIFRKKYAAGTAFMK